jgi:LuxR family quorum-sensing system transcriptional regulator SolR
MSMASLQEELDLLSRAPDRYALLKHTGLFAQRLGFDHFAYVMKIDLMLTRRDHLILTDYPDDWVREYVAGNYFECDPVLAAAQRSPLPVLWDSIAVQVDGGGLGERPCRIWKEAARHGLCHGITLSVRGDCGFAGLFSLARRRRLDLGAEAFVKLVGWTQLLAGFVHAAMVRIDLPDAVPETGVVLTERERQCLQWSGDGKTAWEISQILQISERTAVFHLNNAVAKLGAVNKTQAIARAMLLGLFNHASDSEADRPVSAWSSL